MVPRAKARDRPFWEQDKGNRGGYPYWFWIVLLSASIVLPGFGIKTDRWQAFFDFIDRWFDTPIVNWIISTYTSVGA
jgi:hypothetical protein